jgi:hypothetical protein
MEQLEDKTVWEVTNNGSAGELLILSTACFILAIVYSILYLWHKVKLPR